MDLDAAWTASPSCEQPDLANVQAAVHSNSAFALALYGKLADREGNLVFSPSSITLALSMLLNGARGDTARELVDTLAVSQPVAEHHAAVGGLSRCYSKPQHNPYQFFTANRMFGAKTLKLQQGFGDALKQYKAPVELVDFAHAPDPSRKHINRWVATQTRQNIKEILPDGSISTQTSAVIVNTIYFKGFWQHPFSKQKTEIQPFHAPTSDVDVPLMTLKKRFKYAATSSAQLVELPYKGDRFAMTLIVPKATYGLTKLMRGLDEATLGTWLGRLTPQTVSVYLPRFDVKPVSNGSLKPALKALGLQRVFDSSEADFSALGDAGYFVDDVFHQATVQVDELGTVATAATGLGLARVSPYSDPVVRADHPFLFLIRDTQTGFVLFMGRVEDPR